MSTSKLNRLRKYEDQIGILSKELAEAEKVFKTDPSKDPDVNFEREGIVAALISVQNYLRG